MACHLMLNSTRFGVFLFICSTWLECNWWMWGMHVYIRRWISIFLDLWDFTCILRAWIISSSETPVLGMEGVELASTGQIGGVVQERAGPQNGPVDALNQCNSQVVWAVAFLNVSVYSFISGVLCHHSEKWTQKEAPLHPERYPSMTATCHSLLTPGFCLQGRAVIPWEQETWQQWSRTDVDQALCRSYIATSQVVLGY